MTNMRYKVAKLEADNFLRNGDIHGYVFRHERPFRIDALLDILNNERDFKHDNQFSELAMEVWIDSEHPTTNKSIWRSILNRVNQESIELKEVPDAFIYRGLVADELDKDAGISWTTDLDKAREFANRWRKERGLDGYVLKTTYNPNSFLGVIDRRGESEVIALEPVLDFDILEVIEIERFHENEMEM